MRFDGSVDQNISVPIPRSDVTIDAHLVRRLLTLAGFSSEGLEQIGSGFDNEMWRAGAVVVRLPRRAAAVELLLNEQRWLPELTEHIPLATPSLLWRGEPSDHYPYPWTIQSWIDGEVALRHGPLGTQVAAEKLGHALRAMHRPAPHDAPMNSFRGVALSDRADSFATNNQRDGDRWLERHFHHALRAPRFSGQPRWLHGDVHGGNLVVRDGELVGIIDFGDLCGGDPASDLGGALLATHPTVWNALTDAYRADGGTWQRAFGWLSLFIVLHLSIGGRHAMAADASLRAWRAL